jgi:alpha-N-arabinofuranosidase
MNRREFLSHSALAGAGLALTRNLGWSQSQAAPARIDVLVNEPVGTIAPEIYGHFTEHLGGVIYDGVWVGEGSKVANVGGIRKALVDRLKEIHAPVIRWPGGCFADSYDWKDGIGPRNKRPKRTNFWADDRSFHNGLQNDPQHFETNAFGTDEFMHFCKLAGAEPYVAANVRSLPALDFDHWVEYCNSPAGSTTYSEMRAAAGSAQPYNVKYWGVGNESWGCGGSFTPEDYAGELRRYSTWVPDYGVDLKFVISGPNADDVDWTQRLFAELNGNHPYRNPHLWGLSVHYYVDSNSPDDTQFDTAEWYDILGRTTFIEKIVEDHWYAMGEFDREHRIKLVVDEYGPWYHDSKYIDPAYIYSQQITMRDALATAMTLDIFNNHSEKVGMAACAQLINCIDSLFLARGNDFIVTPNFFVFQMYAAHQGAQAVRTVMDAPGIDLPPLPNRRPTWLQNTRPKQLAALRGSASRQGNTLSLTVVNSSADQPQEAEVNLHGAKPTSARATVLANTDIHAHNTFAQPNAVALREEAANVSEGALRYTFAPASVTRLEIQI